MDDLLAPLLADALTQAAELPALDAVRAEVWASDLIALADELGDDAVARLIDALVAADGTAASAALWAITSVTDEVEVEPSALLPSPRWVEDLGSSTVEAAWLLEERRGMSAAFRFVDRADDRHVIVIDLLPGRAGEPETLGEVVVGPASLLDGLDEPGAGVRREPAAPADLARRVVRALTRTDVPAASLVAAGRLMALRFSQLEIEQFAPPRWVEPDVPMAPIPDPEADAAARQVLERALGSAATPDPVLAREPATRLRAAAAADEQVAQWLAASVGPVDLDEHDITVVTAAIAATVRPADLAPLGLAERQAVKELEWADWLGAVIGLVRTGVGAAVDPEGLVDHVNRCAEVTSSIPKADRRRVAWAFGVCTAPWEPLGLVADGCLTEAGLDILPAALRVAWGDSLERR